MSRAFWFSPPSEPVSCGRYPENVERVPYLATRSAGAYDGIQTLPAVFLLENVRSLYNVGSFFRVADGAGLEALALGGITAHPPHRGISKTALGAEETVRWTREKDPLGAAHSYRDRGYEIAALETSLHSVDLFTWVPRFPVCVVFGHEVDGISKALLDACDTHVRIPMLGRKHSLNVSTAAAVVAYELLRKYSLARQTLVPAAARSN